MILVFGSVNVDLVTRVEAIARPGETVLAPGYERYFGGKGANQAVAALRASGPGGPAVRFCGAVGSDAFGRECTANLGQEGIDVALVQSVDAGTGCAFIQVERSGENAITVASGANLALRQDRVGEDDLAGLAVLVLQMEVPFGENARLASRAKAAGAHVVLNFAPATGAIGAADLRALLAPVDTLVVNEHEGRTLAKALGIPAGDSAHGLAGALGVSVVVTLGAEGSLLAEPGNAEWRCPARPVEVVDTTGAGDTFVGVLSAALAEGVPLRPAIERAGRAASLSCLTAGAQPGMPTRERIEATD